MTNNYGNESIQSLSDREAVRMRVATYAGGDDLNGCFTVVREAVNNIADEFKEGYGSEVLVEYFKDGFIKVTDKARGIPVDFNKNEQKFNHELIFTKLSAGGKFDKDGYTFSSGLNGIGLSLLVLSSEYAKINVTRDGYDYELIYVKGILSGEMSKVKSNKDYTGTSIYWKSDLEVFQDNIFPEEWFTEYLEHQAIVNKGLTLKLINHNTGNEFTYFYENGITDYLKELNEDKAFTPIQYWETETVGRDREDRPEYKSKYEVAFCFNNENTMIESHHNSSYLKLGGSPHEAIKSAFVYSIDKYIKSKGLYEKKEKKIDFSSIADSLSIISNTYSSETSYLGQTKFAITNEFVKSFMDKWLREQLEIYFIENDLEAQKIAQQVLINKRASEKAAQAKLNIKKKLQGNVNVFTNRIDGFINCESKDSSVTELALVEGKSALGSTKQGRDARIQAIYALRGKILNCLKADYDKIFKNEIIVDLIKLLGCGVEVKSKHNKDLNTFDIKNLKWSKILLITDFDQDGAHIKTLLLTMFYRLLPSLINAGKIYIVETPLFEIEHSNQSYFAYSDKEKDEIISTLKGNYIVQRSKGLGENSAEMMWETTMNPANRRLIQVKPDSIENMTSTFELFLGDNLEGRKKFIEDRLPEYIEVVLD